MSNNTTNIKSPAQDTEFFDVTQLAEIAKLVKTDNQGFFNSSPKSEKVKQYVDLLNQYATAANGNVSERAIKTTFKHITGTEHDNVVNHVHTQARTMTAAA